MKFTKDQAYKELVAKMTANGEKLNLSERSINEQLEALIPLVASEETEINDFIEKCLPIFKTSNANVRNDVSNGIKSYIDANPYKKVDDVKKEAKKPEDDVNKELLERLASLEEKLTLSEKEKKVSSVKATLIEKMKSKGVKDDEWINDFISEITITEDFDVENKVESFVKIYNKSKSNVDPNVSPKGSETNGQVNNYISSVIKEAAEKAKSQEKE